MYNDNVNDPRMRDWLHKTVGKEGEDLSRHDKWLCMMYPRLKLLQRLLAEDGAIFISIDDNEELALKAICAEIFGARNYITNFIWRKVDSPNDNKVAITPDHEYILAYAKNISRLSLLQKSAPEIIDAYRQVDENGRRCRDRLLKKNGKTACAVIDQLCFSRLLRQMEPKYCLFTIMEKKHVGLWAKTASRNKLKQELSYGRKGFATVLKVGNHIRANMHRMFPHVHTRVYGQIYRQCDKLRLSLKRYFRHQIYLILLSRQNLLNDFCR